MMGCRINFLSFFTTSMRMRSENFKCYLSFISSINFNGDTYSCGDPEEYPVIGVGGVAYICQRPGYFQTTSINMQRLTLEKQTSSSQLKTSNYQDEVPLSSTIPSLSKETHRPYVNTSCRDDLKLFSCSLRHFSSSSTF